MNVSLACVVKRLCVLTVLLSFGVCAQDWRRYSQAEASNLQRLQTLLAKDNELKSALEEYQASLKRHKAVLAEDEELQKLLRQRDEAKAALEKLRKDEWRGIEISHQNKLIETLERKIRERNEANAELKTIEKEMTQAKQTLREQLEKNGISLFDFRLTLEDFCKEAYDEDMEVEGRSDYLLPGENPFKDAFSDLSKALFQKELANEAMAEISKALAREASGSSPETIGKCIVFFYEPQAFRPIDGKKADKVQEDAFEEYYRILSWMTRLKPKDKEGWNEIQKARKALYRRMERGSLVRFMLAFQWEGQNNPERWMNDFVLWLATHPDDAPLLKYIHEWFNFTYERDFKHEATQMQVLEECLKRMDVELKDPWILHVAQSINAWRRAWDVRGGGYADTVSQQGWLIWEKEKEYALQEARKAVELHPEWPGGYLGILEDFGGNHFAEFRQLMRYRPDFTEAYRKMIWGLLPRWCGSHAHIVALARACMETRRYDTALPSIGFNLLGLVAWDTTPWASWNHVYRQNWLEPLAVELFDARIKQRDWLQRDSRLDKALFFIAVGKYEEASAVVKAVEADNGGKQVVFPSWNGMAIGNWYAKVPAWEDALTHLKVMTGEYAAPLREIEDLATEKGRYDEAIARLGDFLKSHPSLDEKAKEYLWDLRARWQMPDLAANGYSRNSGWGVAFNSAFEKGYTNVIRELMEAGFDYRKYEYYPGAMALFVARQGSSPDMLDLLKEMGDPLDRPERDPRFQGDRPIHFAVMDSNIPMLRKLLDLGISPDATNDHGHTPMHFCAQHGSVEGITILLDAGASPDAQDADGDTPLMFIPQTQVSPHCLQLLAKASKNINLGNRAGMTALHYAAKCGNSPEYIRILLEAGADPQARTPGGEAPYDLAMARNRPDLAALLPKPDPEGGTVYQTRTPVAGNNGNAPTASAGSNDDWGTIVKEYVCMPEVYGIGLCIVIAAIVWTLLKGKKKTAP